MWFDGSGAGRGSVPEGTLINETSFVMSHDLHRCHLKGWSNQTINEKSFTSFSLFMILQTDFIKKSSFYYKNIKKAPGAGVDLTDRSVGLRVTVGRHTDLSITEKKLCSVLLAPAPGTTKKKKTMVSNSALTEL